MPTVLQKKSKSSAAPSGKPAWDIAFLYPMQGYWTEEDYLALERGFGNSMIELAYGCVEILPMPSLKHHRIVKWLDRSLDDFVVPRKLGETAMAPLPVRLFRGQIREPDIYHVFRGTAHS
jgi:Uma2 family endonuclease